MESFYGGKQGRSYKLTAHFDSIKDMVEAFRGGGSYTDVNYDEYVIIDTILRKNDKNNAENGIIYRRGYDYSEEFNANGPTLNNDYTLSPSDIKAFTVYFDNYEQEYTYTEENHLTSGTHSISIQAPIYYDFTYKVHANNNYDVYFIANSFKTDKWNNDWASFVAHPGGGAIYVGQIVGPEGDSPTIEVIEWEDLLEYSSNIPETDEKGNVLKNQFQVNPKPGYDGESTYHDTIQYGYCTLRDAQGQVTGAYISFDIPYTVFNIEAEAVDNYGLPDNLITENNDSIGHPYYKHYNIQVPKGIHGKDVTGMFVGNISKSSAAESGAYLQYTDKDYTNSVNGISQTHELAPYQVIESITDISYDEVYAYSNTTSNYRYPHTLQVNYTYGLAETFDYNVIERIWYQESNNGTLEAGHIYIRLSSQDPNTAPIDVGIIKQVYSITKNQYVQRGIGIDGNYTLEYVDSNDDNIYVNYNDGSYNLLPIAEIAEITFNGDLFLIRFKNIDNEDDIGQTYEYNGKYWINLGTLVKGNHILTNFTTLTALETAYPNGFGTDATTEDRAGWIATVGDANNGYALYAYDYLAATPGWYQIQDMSASAIDPLYSVVVDTATNNMPTNGNTLNENGLWFVIETT